MVSGVVTDPISDMLTRIRNAIAVGHERVAMPSSKMKVGIAQILVDEGFIDRFEVSEEGHSKSLELVLRYGDRRQPVIEGIKRISRPGHRVYSGSKELPRVQGGLGVAVVSTSQGLLPDREARRRRLGGEIVCEVW
jgi:small subunit ribosomal protein S8